LHDYSLMLRFSVLALTIIFSSVSQGFCLEFAGLIYRLLELIKVRESWFTYKGFVYCIGFYILKKELFLT